MRNANWGGIWGPVIHTYSRREAIADGVLRDISNGAAEAGFTVPVAITAAAWDECVRWRPEWSREKQPQDETGRLWDLLQGLKAAAGGASNLKDRVERDNGEILRYCVAVVPPPPATPCQPIATELKAVAHPGDSGEPVITIMLPDED